MQPYSRIGGAISALMLKARSGHCLFYPSTSRRAVCGVGLSLGDGVLSKAEEPVADTVLLKTKWVS